MKTLAFNNLFRCAAKMATKLGVSLILVSVAVSFFLPTRSAAAATGNGTSPVTEICKGTEFPDVCTSILSTDSRSATADRVGLSRISLEQTAKVGDDAAQLALNLTNSASGYAAWSDRSACYHSYNDSIADINQKGLLYFDQKRYNQTYQLVDTFKASVDRCITFGIPELTQKNTVLDRFLTDVKTILHRLF